MAAAWSCATCTFSHSGIEAAFLACALCGTARPEEPNPAQNDAAEAQRGLEAQAAAGQKGQPSPSEAREVEPRKAEDVARRAPSSCATVANLSDEQYCCVWGVEVYEDGWRPEVARALLAKVARHGQQEEGGSTPTPPAPRPPPPLRQPTPLPCHRPTPPHHCRHRTPVPYLPPPYKPAVPANQSTRSCGLVAGDASDCARAHRRSGWAFAPRMAARTQTPPAPTSR